jgi:hypothetical protein
MKKILLLEKIVSWFLVALLIVGFVTATALICFGAYFAFELLMIMKNR